MGYEISLILALAFFVYSITVRQLELARVTGPMFFVFSGALLFKLVGAQLDFTLDVESLLLIIELTLAVFLFSDAAKTKITVLEHSYKYPATLLFIALPLTFLSATLLGLWLFDSLTLLSAMLLAIILTPTDAALSKGLLESTSVPEKVRETINVESGLNDGLCVPVFLFLLESLKLNKLKGSETMLHYLLSEIGIALICAVVITFSALLLLRIARSHHGFSVNSSPFLILALAVIVFSATQYFGGSGFVAAFVGGLIFDIYQNEKSDLKLIEQSEHIADFFAMLVWLVFGAYAMLLITQIDFSWQKMTFAILAATLVRVVPVLMCLAFFRTTSFKDKFTMAWFGPRGLASIVFTLMVIDVAPETVSELATLTILVSVFVHGMTTQPIAALYKRSN